MSGSTYEQRANQHRPTDPATIAAEIRRLAASGLSARVIAGALRIGLAEVLRHLARQVSR